MAGIRDWLADQWAVLTGWRPAVAGGPTLDDGRTIPPDPIARDAHATDHKHERCMNCQTVLTGPFCHVCGQRDDDFRRPFVALSNEFLSDVFQWDSRILRTIVPFLFMPGTLTRAFIQGRRGVFVSPLRLYFVVSLAFFLTLAFANVAILKFEVHGLSDVIAKAVEDGDLRVTGDQNGINVSIDEDEVEQRAEALERAIQDNVQDWTGEVPPDALARIEARREAARLEKAAEREAAGTPATPPPTAEITVLEGVLLGPDPTPETATTVPEEGRSVQVRVRMFAPIDESDQPNDQISDDVIAKMLEDAEGEGAVVGERLIRTFNVALADPRIFNDILNEWLPRLMVFLVPLFAFVMSILYGRKRGLRRRIYFIDHLVFSLHFHAFIFILMIALVLNGRYLGDMIDGGWIALFFFSAIMIHLYAGMKRIYEQGYFKTTVKFIVMAMFMLVTYQSALVGITLYGLWNLRT